ncbi:MAG TPA: tRNA lysidine(34) synthetase TilS, partial [Bdellovibrio sp.]
MKLSRTKRDLDHHVWKQIKQHSLHEKKILVALSGGVDSVALLRVFSKIHKAELLGACYFHHGEESNQE